MKWNKGLILFMLCLLLSGQLSYLIGVASASSESLMINLEPTKPEGYAIDMNSGVATADIILNIDPQGKLENEPRLKPMDVIFVLDVGVSKLDDTERDLLRYQSKIKAYKDAARASIETLKGKAINGDRFALITFDSVAKVNKNFENGVDPTTQLNGIKAEVDKIKDGTGFGLLDLLIAILKGLTTFLGIDFSGLANYEAALNLANQTFGNSTNSKYIIFITDGKPGGSDSKTVTRDIDGFYEPQICLGCENKKYYIKQDNTKIFNNVLGNFSEFNYNGNPPIVNKLGIKLTRFKYSRNYNIFDLAAIDAAGKLAEKDAKLYSIGFGTKRGSDAEFLRELSNLTGATSYTAENKDQLTSDMQRIIDVVTKTALKNIKLTVNLKNGEFPADYHIGIPEDSNAYKTEDGNFAIISIPDIEYLPDGGTPNQVDLPFTMEFDKPGNYTFHDAKLTYTDFAGQEQSVDAPFTIKVIDNESFGLKFKNPPYAINVYKNPSKLTLDLNSELEVVPPPGLKLEDIEKPTKFTWSSSDEKVAKVNNGIVTATGVGTTVITVEAKDKKDNIIRATTQVKVNLQGISFGKTLYEFTSGSKNMFNELKAKPNGFNFSPTNFNWTVSGDNTILSVDSSGIIERNGTEAGFVILTAELKDEYKIDGDPAQPNDKATTLIKINKTDGSIGDPQKEW